MPATGCELYNKKVVARWIGCKSGSVGFKLEVQNDHWENRLFEFTEDKFPPAIDSRNWMSYSDFKNIVDNYGKKPICGANKSI